MPRNRNEDFPPEENDELRESDQAQDVAEDALEIGTSPSGASEHGGGSNRGAVVPDDAPDLIDTMNQMVSSGHIDHGAFRGEPMHDDEEDRFGQTDPNDEDGEDLPSLGGDLAGVSTQDIREPFVGQGRMDHITYRVVEHDGGWTYKQGDTFTETYRTHDEARAAAVLACREQGVSGDTAYIEYQQADGHWITERADGADRPGVDVTG
uniref:hypothetical protein n=1 Tax=uncultured Sphingomonas sp. TaxID=158754 RepID=UPI0025DBC6FA|nr:hypothetical protein [uncultured Sphingomonas sp.]